MNKRIIFEGCATALITPFKGGALDLDAMGALIDNQILAGVDALVIAGTTGEASCLTSSERERLFYFSRERASGRCKLILGVGSNDTATAIANARLAEKVGCDGVLAVTPYYNKGTRLGLKSHYLAIAESTSLPILLYNVPSRTGVNIPIETVRSLAEHPNVVGIKEASDSQDRLTELSSISEDMPLYAGNDSQIYSTLALGGLGAISVASNAVPKLIMKLIRDFKTGKWREALALQLKLLPFISSLFIETNPAPIKFLCAHLGLCEGDIRLPLSEVPSDVGKIILKEYERVSRIQA